MKRLQHMNSYELRDYLEFLGADKKRLYGTGNNAMRLLACELERTDGETWVVTMYGDVVYSGCEMRCAYTVSKDETGLMEMGREKDLLRRNW